MRKSFFGLVVAGATLASAIVSASPAFAVRITVNAQDYNVSISTGSYNQLVSTIKSSAAWGNQNLAQQMSQQTSGLFAWDTFSPFPGATLVDYFSGGSPNNVGATAPNQPYAIATAVPWETDALPVIGSTILFAGGLWARNKFAKPLQK
jgi:hypothetical protein